MQTAVCIQHTQCLASRTHVASLHLMYNGMPLDNAIWNEECAKSRID